MNSEADVRTRLDHFAAEFTPQERRLAAHMVEHLEQWGYQSSSELAASLGLHRSTIVRFAQHVGYTGFPELQASARAAYLEAVSAPRGLVLSTVGRSDAGGTVQSVYQKEVENMQRSYAHLDLESLDVTAKAIASARRVVLFGRRFSFPLALHLSLILRTIRSQVDVAPSPGDSSVDQLFDLGEEDFVLAVSLKRHSPEVQRTLRFLVEAGVPVTILTDASPGDNVPTGVRILRAHVGSTGVLDSFTALTSVSHALLTLVEAAMPDNGRLKSVEQAWAHFNET